MTRRRYNTLFERLVANTVEDTDGCWIWQGVTRHGYGAFSARRPGCRTPRQVPADRAMLECTTGWLFPFDEAGHYRCFKPACIHPDHLRIETQAENLSTRRGYAECAGRWVPVLFPTPGRELDDAVDAAWSHAEVGGVYCPF